MSHTKIFRKQIGNPGLAQAGRRLSFSLVAVAALLFCQSALATLYLQDAINYTVGTALGNDTPWQHPTNAVSIAGGSLTYPGLANLSPAGNLVAATDASGGNSYSYRAFDTTANSGSVYFSFLAKCTALPGSSGYYISGLLPSATTTPGGRATDPMVLMTKSSGSGYVLGVGSANDSAARYASTVLTLNSTNLVVLKYVLSSRVASIFINPTPGNSEPAANTNAAGTISFNDLQYVYLRFAGGGGSWNFDSLRIGSTWPEVTPAPNQPPTIAPSGQPQDQTVLAGANVNFSVTVDGTPQFSYQWRKDGSTFGAATVSSFTTNTLTLNSVTSSDSADYDVVVTNSFGSITSTVAHLTVNVPPGVTLQPQPQAVCAAGTATFTAAASGVPAPTVRWQVSSNAGMTWTDVPGATSTTYSFAPLQGDTGKQYRAVFTNAGGTANSLAAALTVSTPVAADAGAGAVQNQVLILDIAALLAACSAPDGDAFYLSSVGPLSTNGAPVAITATNTIYYTPAPGFTGADRFNYTITDILGCSATGAVYLTVSP